MARGIGALVRAGWRPLRSIYFCSWDGEEAALIGSTAFGERFADEPFLKRAAAYLNVDEAMTVRAEIICGPNYLPRSFSKVRLS